MSNACVHLKDSERKRLKELSVGIADIEHKLLDTLHHSISNLFSSYIIASLIISALFLFTQITQVFGNYSDAVSIAGAAVIAILSIILVSYLTNIGLGIGGTYKELKITYLDHYKFELKRIKREIADIKKSYDNANQKLCDEDRDWIVYLDKEVNKLLYQIDKAIKRVKWI